MKKTKDLSKRLKKKILETPTLKVVYIIIVLKNYLDLTNKKMEYHQYLTTNKVVTMQVKN